MANLKLKKLSRMPIGTHVEITYSAGDSNRKISGILTDSDFSESVEITAYDGECIVLDFSLILGVLETKPIKEILTNTPIGTKVRFSYGDENQREPNTAGTVTDNDNEESIEISVSTGKEIVLDYDLIRSFLVINPAGTTHSKAKEAAAPVIDLMKSTRVEPSRSAKLLEQEPEDILNASDGKIKELFEEIPPEERKKLNGVYDSFKYGIRINDRSKMQTAANQARQILFREDDQGYVWSVAAVRLCGSLLRRVNDFDGEVFLVGECFQEAAYAFWRSKEYALAGAYAILALTESKAEDEKDMTIILASSVVNAEDASGLYLLANSKAENCLKVVIQAAFEAKGIRVDADQNIHTSLQMLESLYPNDAIKQEIQGWVPEEEPVSKPNSESDTNSNDSEQSEQIERYTFGTIQKLNWAENTGTIAAEDGNSYSFRYSDLLDPKLNKVIVSCMRADLYGKQYLVKFFADDSQATNIQFDDMPVERARNISADKTREDRFTAAYDLCKKALYTPEGRMARSELIRISSAIFKSTQETKYLEDALEIYEADTANYPNNAFAVMGVAQAYSYIGKYPQMLEYGEKALSFDGIQVKQKITLLSMYLTNVKAYYEASGNRALLTEILEKTERFKTEYASDLDSDPKIKELYSIHLLHHRIYAECGLSMLEEAEKDYAQLPNENEALDELMAETRMRLAPEQPDPAEEVHAVRQESDTSEPVAEAAETDNNAEHSIPDQETDEEEDEIEKEIPPYVDAEGWDALKLTKQCVVDYALGIDGPERIPAILAYLRVGAALNQEIEPVYHAVALAANDPLEAPDYSITSLVTSLDASDTDYPVLSDCCMAAAFLRASFISGREYDYSAPGLRSSIAVCHQLPALCDVYDTLEEFRKETTCAIDIYADYRNHGAKKLQEELDATVRHAEDLYAKFVLTPPRESAKFARLLETKKIVFARDGYLATMLNYMIERNQAALDAQRDRFVATYLNGVDQFSAKRISENAVNEMIAACWDAAGENLLIRKTSADLQGDRRNNLRSSITEILRTICQWYALAEQSAGLTWKSAQGEAAYQRMKPQLMDQLRLLSQNCAEEIESSPNRELSTGMFLLSATAQELYARLDGSWKHEQEKFLYADFLRSNQIMLDEDFMPELTSTFCALPEFNILARIRRHVEGPKLSFQEQIDRIYSMDKTGNNYGTADRIVSYLNAAECSETVVLPDEPERFVAHTEMQIDMRYKSFRETYALAMNYGQIIKSDMFCNTLEDTVRYWYAFCKETKNYGFFSSILIQAENHIHESAQQYEVQLDEQLDALIASNQQYFDEHSDYAEAIRGQIANQNFTVAEDWMARIRIGDFSLEIQQPEALMYLERFWNSYVKTYNRVADAGRTLSALIGRREIRNKDTRGAQQLIDNWLNSGAPSTPRRIGALLNLLGFNNINVTQYSFAAEPKCEIYEVRKDTNAAGWMIPQHPIAAYGSKLAEKPMYVVCLYGTYDCDRLYLKMSNLDIINGNKIFLLDYALGQVDRRTLACKLKKRESILRNVNIVIDRVLITHLSDYYNESMVNRVLMATAMPFTYCQPYVADSSHTMPPEIFIGRKEELLKIEQADGVNLIYGGRQLGKSALFKKAVSDIDGHQKQRAALIDIKELNCAAAAYKVSTKLIDLGITPDAEATEDWDTLCRSIDRRMLNQEDEIPYFLLMLDEADTFIQDCANYGYRPLVALKDVQQTLPGRFKYVLAGLHNVVKFNREVALGNNSVIPHISSLKITPFRTPEAQELLINPLSYLGFSLPSKVTISQILATCNYFPGLIQFYATKLIESVRATDYAGYDIKKTPPYVVSDKHLRRIIADRDFQAKCVETFEMTSKLDKDQGNYYFPLALLIGLLYNVAPSKNGYTAETLLYHARDLSVYPLVDLDETKIDALLQELQDLNILRSVSDNSYLLASKNFRDLLGSDEEIFKELGKLNTAGGTQE